VGTVDARVTAATPVAPVTVIVQPDVAGPAAVAVKAPVAEVAGVTVTWGQLDVAAKLPA
jgi:hypothetical protein